MKAMKYVLTVIWVIVLLILYLVVGALPMLTAIILVCSMGFFWRCFLFCSDASDFIFNKLKRGYLYLMEWAIFADKQFKGISNHERR